LGPIEAVGDPPGRMGSTIALRPHAGLCGRDLAGVNERHESNGRDASEVDARGVRPHS